MKRLAIITATAALLSLPGAAQALPVVKAQPLAFAPDTATVQTVAARKDKRTFSLRSKRASERSFKERRQKYRRPSERPDLYRPFDRARLFSDGIAIGPSGHKEILRPIR